MSNQDHKTGTKTQIMCLRLAYAIAIGATLLQAVFFILNDPLDLLFSIMGQSKADLTEAPPLFQSVFTTIRIGLPIGYLLLAGLMIFLLIRPYGWGKLVTAFCAFSWGMFAVNLTVMAQMIEPTPFDIRLLPVIIGAIGMLTAAILHQIADPRFSGPYLR